MVCFLRHTLWIPRPGKEHSLADAHWSQNSRVSKLNRQVEPVRGPTFPCIFPWSNPCSHKVYPVRCHVYGLKLLLVPSLSRHCWSCQHMSVASLWLMICQPLIRLCFLCSHVFMNICSFMIVGSQLLYYGYHNVAAVLLSYLTSRSHVLTGYSYP